MKKHTQVYFDYFRYTTADFIACECCGAKAVDIHHIVSRGMGGVANNRLDIIENLQAVCRSCHDKYGDNPNCLAFLVQKHSKAIGHSFIELMEKIKSL